MITTSTCRFFLIFFSVLFYIESKIPENAPNWYYKSWQVCTNSDSAGTAKCTANSTTMKCGNPPDVASLYCDEGDKKSCEQIGSSVSKGRPNGFGFMCPSLMLGSSEMLAAATSDGYDGAYAVVTLDKLKCGQCIEMTNDDTTTYPNAPKITAQIFNSVADSIDVYMAGGGLGAQNGCIATSVAQRKPMAEMYKKYPTSTNTEFVNYLVKIGYKDAASQIDQATSYSGGIRGGKAYAECVASGKSFEQCQPSGNGCNGGGGLCILNASACTLAFEGKSDFVTNKARESCQYVFEHDLHWNRPVTYSVVTCPVGLLNLTGLIPSSPEIITSSNLKNTATTTTMEDCCEPSCARQPFVAQQGFPSSHWKPGFDATYTCNINGEKYYEQNTPSPDPCNQA